MIYLSAKSTWKRKKEKWHLKHKNFSYLAKKMTNHLIKVCPLGLGKKKESYQLLNLSKPKRCLPIRTSSPMSLSMQWKDAERRVTLPWMSQTLSTLAITQPFKIMSGTRKNFLQTFAKECQSANKMRSSSQTNLFKIWM